MLKSICEVVLSLPSTSFSLRSEVKRPSMVLFHISEQLLHAAKLEEEARLMLYCRGKTVHLVLTLHQNQLRAQLILLIML